MKKTNILLAGAFFLSLNSFSMLAMAENTIDADDFVEEASAKGIAEIETSKLALQKGVSPDVKTFAQKMIDDHTAANKELAAVAARKKLEVDTEAELMAKAKKMMLKQRDGESFDAAYATGQVAAHESTIALFQKGAKSTDADIAAFATATLPKLEHHLHMAHDLAAKTSTTKSEVKAEKKAADK